MITASQLLYRCRFPAGEKHEGTCYVCGGDLYDPMDIKEVIKSTFNDYANINAGGTGVCNACQWFMLYGKREDLAQWLGRDKPQFPRTYSHIAKDGTWHILSKGQKDQILSLLIDGFMPETCLISVTGQKHLFYKGRVNPPSASAGWVLYEEQHVWIEQDEFRNLVEHVLEMYLPDYGFNKQAILTGRYNFNKPESVGLYEAHEPGIAPYRGGVLLDLAVYLVTKPKDSEDENDTK